MTLKQGQGHQTWHEFVDPKQGYNNAKFEKPRFNSVREKANNKDLSNQETSESQKQWYIHDLLDTLNYLTEFKFNKRET